MQFIVKKINQYACEDDEDADDNDPFSCITVHTAKIRRIVPTAYAWEAAAGNFNSQSYGKKKGTR